MISVTEALSNHTDRPYDIPISSNGQEAFRMPSAIVFAILYLPIGVIFLSPRSIAESG